MLSDEERAIRVASLEDAATDANDRADQWETAAKTLRDRIDSIAAQAQSLNASANADNVTPAQATAINNSLSDLAAMHDTLTQELDTAERNERDARAIAARDAQAARHPEQPMTDSELADLRTESKALIERSKSDIARLDAENEKLAARLEDDHRVESASRA